MYALFMYIATINKSVQGMKMFVRINQSDIDSSYWNIKPTDVNIVVIVSRNLGHGYMISHRPWYT